VLLAGLLMGVAPSSLPLVSVVVGSVAGGGDSSGAEFGGRQGLIFAGGFVLGIATIDALIGATFGFFGHALIRALAGSLALTNLVIAVLLAGMGLALLRVVHIPWLRIDARPRAITSFAGAYALGLPFGLSTCPACTPMILPVLGAAAATGEPLLGAALMFTFGLARGLPLLLAGAATGAVAHLRSVTLWIPRIERTGGGLVLIVAAFFAYQSAAYAGLVPPLLLPTSL
jgi:cytochrome c-type biogenesis protein